MKVFIVDRTDEIQWTEDYKMIVIADDEKHAERRARLSSEDFKKATLKITEVDLSKEQVIATENTGA